MNESATLDKSSWPDGPWKNEPDRLEWRAPEVAPYPLLIVRSDVTGALCGYVGVPRGHQAYARDCDSPYLYDIRVHGGLTYVGPCQGAICHVPAPGEPDDVWWLGFDCSHIWDRTPARYTTASGTYRDLAFVKAEVESLARQLAEMAR